MAKKRCSRCAPSAPTWSRPRSRRLAARTPRTATWSARAWKNSCIAAITTAYTSSLGMATTSSSRFPTRSTTIFRPSAVQPPWPGATTTARSSQRLRPAALLPPPAQESTDMQKNLNKMTAAGFATLTIAAASLFSIAARAADTISVVTFGGAYEAAAKKAYFEPFTAATGIGFSTESYDGGLAKLSAMEQAKAPTWDLIDLESNDAITGCDEGLLRKIDRKSLGDTSAFIPGSIMDCAVAAMVWSTVYAYDTTKLKTPPTTINDFFDLKKFPGKRGLRKSPKVTLEWALLAEGVKPADVYKVLGTPAGVDRAFKKLDTIKPSIVWWEAGAQPPQLLSDGAVVMTQVYNGRIDDAVHKDHKPFVSVWDGQVYDFEWWGIPMGAKNGDA